MREEKGETWAIEWRDRRANSPGLLLARLFFSPEKWGEGRIDELRTEGRTSWRVQKIRLSWRQVLTEGAAVRRQRDCAVRVSHVRQKLLISFRQCVRLLPRCSPQSKALLLPPPPGFRYVATPKAQFLHNLATFFLINPTFLQTWPVAVGKIRIFRNFFLSKVTF